jgi:hypothetical protein
MIAVITPDLASGLGVGWVVAGVGVALVLHRRGQPAATALAALVVWPVLLPLVWASPAVAAGGPNAGRIEATAAAVRATLREAGGADEALLAALGGLVRALHEADARVGRVDALLAAPSIVEDHPGVQRARTQLVDGRRRALDEIDAVLAELVQLQLQVGLQALAGAPRDLSDRIASLEGRIRALHEVDALGGRR